MRSIALIGLAATGLVLTGCPGTGDVNDGPDGGDNVNDGPDGGGGDGPPPPPGPALLDLSAGSNHTCALLDNRTVRCWGDNREGQLGDGTTTSRVRPITVLGLSGVGTVATGHAHSCAVLEDGTARCWGRNSSGQLGNNTKVDSEMPVPVMGLSGIRSIHPGVTTTCALTLVGRVYCWGRGGELGDGAADEALEPRLITSLTNVAQLSVSSNGDRAASTHVCGVRLNGTAFCWGANDEGQCGNGSQLPAPTPTEVVGLTDAVEIAAGGGHACVRGTGAVSCWGTARRVGDGTSQRRSAPATVPTEGSIVGVLAGDRYTLMQNVEGALFCWGESDQGECGDGAQLGAGSPVYLSPIATLTTHLRTVLVEAGGAHACAYNSATSVTTCWGSNDLGQLGSGEPAPGARTSTPQPVAW